MNTEKSFYPNEPLDPRKMSNIGESSKLPPFSEILTRNTPSSLWESTDFPSLPVYDSLHAPYEQEATTSTLLEAAHGQTAAPSMEVLENMSMESARPAKRERQSEWDEPNMEVSRIMIFSGTLCAIYKT